MSFYANFYDPATSFLTTSTVLVCGFILLIVMCVLFFLWYSSTQKQTYFCNKNNCHNAIYKLVHADTEFGPGTGTTYPLECFDCPERGYRMNPTGQEVYVNDEWVQCTSKDDCINKLIPELL